MKIAVFSDIHANFEALMCASEHVEQWNPDFVVVSGDIINRGPRPLECLKYILGKVSTKNWLLVRGNHEDYVISQSLQNAPIIGPASEVHRASTWTLHKLTDTTSLQAMPFQQSIYDPSGCEVRFVHASMRGNRDGIYPETSNNELKDKIKLAKYNNQTNYPALFCVGHTHRALIKDTLGIKIVNAGSVGLPFDGDHRLAYAQLVFKDRRWAAKIVRIDYDLGKAEKDFYQSGYYDEAGPLIKLVLVELKTATSQLYNWSVKYHKLALSGKITMQESVQRYLQSFSK